MASTALAFDAEHDEVPVSSTEVLEANVASIRVDLNELKTDFRAAVARIDGEIKSAVTKLEGEIRDHMGGWQLRRADHIGSHGRQGARMVLTCRP